MRQVLETKQWRGRDEIHRKSQENFPGAMELVQMWSLDCVQFSCCADANVMEACRSLSMQQQQDLRIAAGRPKQYTE